METVARRRGGGIFESLYKVVMRRNSVYVTFVIAGAFLGERAVDYGIHKLWEANNVGIAKATLVPDTSYIAKPAASWLDDFLVWVSLEAFGCTILGFELDESQSQFKKLPLVEKSVIASNLSR